MRWQRLDSNRDDDPMKCQWKEIETADERGWRRVQCVRCSFIAAPTPDTLGNIDRDCNAIPFAREIGHWLATLLAGIGITPTSYVHAKAYCGLGTIDGDCGCPEKAAKLNRLGEATFSALASSYLQSRGLVGR